jgi:hypothetical protein
MGIKLLLLIQKGSQVPQSGDSVKQIFAVLDFRFLEMDKV